jgi:eukaryotic-like serine/threonine-protein kinase
VLTMPNLGQGELDHGAPQVLPGGQAVLFSILTTGGPQIAVLNLTTREQKILIRGGLGAWYVPTGHLVYGVDLAGPLRAVGFDVRRLEVVGTPVPVLDEVKTVTNRSLALDGTLVYVAGGAEAQPTFTLVWVDRQGREQPLKAPPRLYRYPRLSPDGSRLALDLGFQERDIWIWDFARETLTRLTFDPRLDSHPAWTPDGQRLVFRSTRGGPSNLFWQAADGTGAIERLTENSNNQQFPGSFSPDGTRLVFREETTTTGADLMVLALEGGRRTSPRSQGVGGRGSSTTSEVRPLVRTSFNELNGRSRPTAAGWRMSRTSRGKRRSTCGPFRTSIGAAGRFPRAVGTGRCGRGVEKSFSTGRSVAL